MIPLVCSSIKIFDISRIAAALYITCNNYFTNRWILLITLYCTVPVLVGNPALRADVAITVSLEKDEPFKTSSRFCSIDISNSKMNAYLPLHPKVTNLHYLLCGLSEIQKPCFFKVIRSSDKITTIGIARHIEPSSPETGHHDLCNVHSKIMILLGMQAVIHHVYQLTAAASW